MYPSDAIKIYSELESAERWLRRFSGAPWSLACTLGFTETALIPGISAAGKTPSDRRWTAYADAEFLAKGAQGASIYPLPPLEAGLSPVLISRALAEALAIPITLLDAGLLNELNSTLLSPKLSPTLPATELSISKLPPSNPGPSRPSLRTLIPLIDLGGTSARCLSTGQALDFPVVQSLFQVGLAWGQTLAQAIGPNGYLVLGECVVGGTTTALGVLTGLGVSAKGRVNSSHPQCNHQQKQLLVQQGLQQAGYSLDSADNWVGSSAGNLAGLTHAASSPDPFRIVAAVGDPMQIVVAALAIAASQTVGVLLAGGTQMLAVYALAAAIHQQTQINWNPELVVVGTTRWVAEDPTGDTPGLVQAIGDRFPQVPAPVLLATTLNFTHSRHPALRLYEAGFVKEGVGAGGSAIAASLSNHWSGQQLCAIVDEFCDRYYDWRDQEMSSSW